MADSSLRARFVVLLALVLMLLPVCAVVLNAFATEWSGTILPAGFTLQWFDRVVADPAFRAAIGRSVIVALGALVLSAAVTIPAVIVGHLYWPRLDAWLGRFVVIHYALPAVVLVVGYYRLYSGYPLPLNGTPYILFLAYVPIFFPLLYISMKNGLSALPTADFLAAGRLLGASDVTIIRRVILPSIMPAILIGLVLNFALGISEFVFANMLVGGHFETLQIYMFKQRQASGRITSVVVAAYFIVMLVGTALALLLIGRRDTQR
jgi:putative spermidine/putrescine transport system permease protein